MSKEFPDKYHASADELAHRQMLQEEYHDKPLKSVTEFIERAITKVIETLGVNPNLGDEMMKMQQEALGIIIAERPPEEMGKLSGFYVIAGGVPIAIIGDAFLGNDGLAWLDIYWIQKETMERWGGVRIIQ